MRALRGGTRAAPRPPPLGKRRLGKGAHHPRFSEGRAWGHCPHGRSPGGVPGQGLELDGTAGRAPLPTAGAGRRPPGPSRAEEALGAQGPLGARTLAGVEGTELSWGAQVPPSIPGQDRIPLTAPHRAYPTAEPRVSPACYPPTPADSVQSGAGPAPVLKPTGVVSKWGRVPGRSQRDRECCRSGGSAPAHRASCSPEREPALGALWGSARAAPALGRRGEAAGGQRCVPRLCSASDGTPRPAPGTSPACEVLSGFLSVKHRDNYKPLKTDGVSSHSFTDCKPPRSATRCKHCPLRSSSPPKKGQTQGKRTGSVRESSGGTPAQSLAVGRERASPPASSP